MITTLLTFGGCGSKKDNTTTEELNFYRTEEDLFIVVDPETTDVVSVE